MNGCILATDGGSGNFADRPDRFAGLRSELARATHFGWVRLTAGPHAASVTVEDYAFNLVPDEALPTSLAALVELFAGGFESGNTSGWSTTAP